MTTKRTLQLLAIAIASIVGFFIYFNFNPAEVPFPRCFLLQITGYKCPGCGSQRAIHQLLHLNIIQAFKYNAALVIYAPILPFLCYVNAKRISKPKLYAKVYNIYFIWATFVFLCGWWILRNVFDW